MTEIKQYRISLRITHPDAGTESISSALGLIPKISYTAGDKSKTPKGKDIAGYRDQSYWCYQLVELSDNFEYDLKRLLGLLEKNRDFLEVLSVSGGEFSLFVSLFPSEKMEIIIDNSILRNFADLKINLMFDIYA